MNITTIVIAFFLLIMLLSFLFVLCTLPILKYLNEQKELQDVTQSVEFENNPQIEKMVAEWEDYGICAPKEILGNNSKDICRKFQKDCHKCLTHYASVHPEQYLLADICNWHSNKAK